jgi:hypothetical protein
MQFRTLSVAVVVLAVVVVVMAADPPSADVLHAKCYHNGDKHWHIAGEQLDEEAMKVSIARRYITSTHYLMARSKAAFVTMDLLCSACKRLA